MYVINEEKFRRFSQETASVSVYDGENLNDQKKE